MKRIEVDTNILRRNISSIESAIAKVRSEINDAYEGIRALDSMWDGPANAAFNKQFLSDYNRMIEICDVLERYAANLTEVREQYENGESHVADIVAAIRI